MKIIAALNGLGEYLNTKDEALKAQINSVSNYNAWFNSANVTIAIDAWAKLLTSENLTHWINAEGVLANPMPKKVGLVLAGNIPMVGFHDILSVLITGHEAHIKLSSQDQQLIPMLLEKLISIAPELKNKIFYPDRLNAVDAVIATGSDNSSRYFEYYFGHKPHIIRKNRTSIAVLDGSETEAELLELSNDVHLYFGLGCRNVSKIFVPKNYDFVPLLRAFDNFNSLGNHHKFRNNYDYQLSICLINSIPYMTNECTILLESKLVHAPISVLYYEFYDANENPIDKIANENELQCIIGKNHLPFGKSQIPGLFDYADDVDTIEFLSQL
jgi:hypothetical protein